MMDKLKNEIDFYRTHNLMGRFIRKVIQFTVILALATLIISMLG